MNTQQKLIRDFIWFLIAISFIAYAGKVNAQVLPEYSAFPTSSVGFQIGTQGLSAQGTYSFARSFNVRVGFLMVPDVTFLYNDRNLRIDRQSVYAIIDWQPMYGNNQWFARKWFVSAGFGYYFDNTLYRQGYKTLPDYQIYMSRYRPYIGTGLGNIHIYNSLNLRLDLGDYIPTTSPVSTYENKAETITRGLRGLLPGLNTAATFYIKF